MEKGKNSEEYIREISTLFVNPEDCSRLGLSENSRATLKSSAGEIIVRCRPAEGPEGIFFLPVGPLANQLIGEETLGTGVPDFKGTPVTIIASC
jgi:formylmethanofuran dehydrogenase subunit D